MEESDEYYGSETEYFDAQSTSSLEQGRRHCVTRSIFAKDVFQTIVQRPRTPPYGCSIRQTLHDRYFDRGARVKLRTPRTLTRLMQQHRDSERSRHRELNKCIEDMSKRIPGYNPNVTKIVQLQRIISYICHLEGHIQNLCEEQKIDLEYKNLFLSPHIGKDVLEQAHVFLKPTTRSSLKLRGARGSKAKISHSRQSSDYIFDEEHSLLSLTPDLSDEERQNTFYATSKHQAKEGNNLYDLYLESDHDATVADGFENDVDTEASQNHLVAELCTRRRTRGKPLTVESPHQQSVPTASRLPEVTDLGDNPVPDSDEMFVLNLLGDDSLLNSVLADKDIYVNFDWLDELDDSSELEDSECPNQALKVSPEQTQLPNSRKKSSSDTTLGHESPYKRQKIERPFTSEKSPFPYKNQSWQSSACAADHILKSEVTMEEDATICNSTKNTMQFEDGHNDDQLPKGAISGITESFGRLQSPSACSETNLRNLISITDDAIRPGMSKDVLSGCAIPSNMQSPLPPLRPLFTLSSSDLEQLGYDVASTATDRFVPTGAPATMAPHTACTSSENFVEIRPGINAKVLNFDDGIKKRKVITIVVNKDTAKLLGLKKGDIRKNPALHLSNLFKKNVNALLGTGVATAAKRSESQAALSSQNMDLAWPPNPPLTVPLSPISSDRGILTGKENPLLSKPQGFGSIAFMAHARGHGVSVATTPQSYVSPSQSLFSPSPSGGVARLPSLLGLDEDPMLGLGATMSPISTTFGDILMSPKTPKNSIHAFMRNCEKKENPSNSPWFSQESGFYSSGLGDSSEQTECTQGKADTARK